MHVKLLKHGVIAFTSGNKEVSLLSESTTDKVKSCTFWQLSEKERAEVIATAPIKDVWELDMERLEDGHWQFSIPELKTINELMVGGTEKIMDFHYKTACGIEPDDQSRMVVRVSSKPMELNHAILHKIAADGLMGTSATYHDQISEITGWLCGWIAIPFGGAPDTIYANVFPYS